MAPFFKTRSSAPFNTIWTAWQLTSHKLSWYDQSLSHGLSFASSSIWWNQMVQQDDAPLAKIKSLKGRYLFKKGIQVFRDFWDLNTFNWKSWQQLKAQFQLSPAVKDVVLKIQQLVTPELLCLLSTSCHDNFLKDWKWPNNRSFRCFPLKIVYQQLLLPVSLPPRLNLKWNCKFNREKWNILSSRIWHSKVDAQSQLVAWKILHVKLPIGDRLHFLTPSPSCPFCSKRESIMHTFWLCPHARSLWCCLSSTFPAIVPHKWTWRSALLGLSQHHNLISQTFRQIILKFIWRLRCLASFSHTFFPLHIEILMLNADFLLHSTVLQHTLQTKPDLQVTLANLQMQIKSFKDNLQDTWMQAPENYLRGLF